MTITIYHNPDCGTSRNVLGLIRNSGEEPHIIEYLKAPLGRAELVDLIGRMGILVRVLLREKGTLYAELGLGDLSLTDDQLLDARMAHPILINRPVVVTPKGARLCRRPRRCWIFCRSRNASLSPRKMVSRSWTGRQSRRGAYAMSEAVAVSPGKAPTMGTFERYLTLWVALCIVFGIGLAQAVPGVFHALGRATVAEINLPVAVLVWLMIVPMLLKIDLMALGQAGRHWRGIMATAGINWLVKPFSMALLGWLFIGYRFRLYLPSPQIDPGV